jgi:hypothetical protein
VVFSLDFKLATASTFENLSVIEEQTRPMNMNRNFPDGEDSVSLAIVTASEDSNSPGGNSDLRGGSGGSERNESEKEGGSGGSDNGGNSGGSDNGEQENNEEDQDSTKPNEVREKRRVRVMANRRSARESRDRRKRLLSDLRRSVDTLKAGNSELAKSNHALRQELEQILQKCGLTDTLRSSIISNLSIQALLMGQRQSDRWRSHS